MGKEEEGRGGGGGGERKGEIFEVEFPRLIPQEFLKTLKGEPPQPSPFLMALLLAIARIPSAESAARDLIRSMLLQVSRVSVAPDGRSFFLLQLPFLASLMSLSSSSPPRRVSRGIGNASRHHFRHRPTTMRSASQLPLGLGSSLASPSAAEERPQRTPCCQRLRMPDTGALPHPPVHLCIFHSLSPCNLCFLLPSSSSLPPPQASFPLPAAGASQLTSFRDQCLSSPPYHLTPPPLHFSLPFPSCPLPPLSLSPFCSSFIRISLGVFARHLAHERSCRWDLVVPSCVKVALALIEGAGGKAGAAAAAMEEGE